MSSDQLQAGPGRGDKRHRRYHMVGGDVRRYRDESELALTPLACDATPVLGRGKRGGGRCHLITDWTRVNQDACRPREISA